MAKIIHHVIRIARSEWLRVLSFGIIGSISLVLTMGLYALLSRVMWVSGPHTLEYVIVVVIVTWLNYELNRHFTFDKAKRSRQTMARFTMVAVVALGLNAVLFWFGHEVLHLSDFLVIIATALLVALFTFTSHRLFTFRVEAVASTS